MSKKTVQLIPTRKGESVLPSSYMGKDEVTHYLVANGKKVVVQLLADHKTHIFRSMNGRPIEITIEDNASGNAVLNWLKNHPVVYTDGHHNPNATGAHTFELSIKQEKVIVDFERLTTKLKVLSIINSMDPEAIYDMAFAIGGNPQGMDMKELYLYMVGVNLDGKAMAFANDVLNLGKITNREREAKTFAQKAINYGIVDKVDGVFKVAGNTAGRTINDVVALLMGNSDLYENFVKPEVGKFDKDAHKVVKTFNMDDIREQVIDVIPVEAVKKTRSSK